MNTFLNQYLAVVIARRLEEDLRMSRGHVRPDYRERRRERRERGTPRSR